jgi:putative molybdopterin biosynthesis protein
VLDYTGIKTAMRPLMNTQEVADFLRLKERKIYDLVARQAIPHSRVSGKLLFPRVLIDEWVKRGMAGNLVAAHQDAPAVLAGSSDPLLEWAVRESRCGLATMTYGSMDGVGRLIAGDACGAAMHIPNSGNLQVAKERLSHLDCALIRWASREQGLIVPTQNPLKISSLADLVKPDVRVVVRQQGAGSYLLYLQLLSEAGINPDAIQQIQPNAQTESDVASAILDGRADAGLAVRAVAQQFHLGFIPLITEHLDVAVIRKSYFDAPFQTLLAFTNSVAFRRYAASLAGYDVAQLGQVLWNA